MAQHRSQHNDKGKQVVDGQRLAKRCCLNSTPRAPTGVIIREPSNDASFSDASSDEDMPIQLPTTLSTDSIFKSVEALEKGESSNARKRSRDAELIIPYPMVTTDQMQAPCDLQNKPSTNDTSKQRNARRERDRARRKNLTAKEREEINARRRAQYQNMTPRKREEINARRRARRHSLILEKKKSCPDEYQEDIQWMNARRREHWRTLPVEQKEAINARRRARRHSLAPDERQALLDQLNASCTARGDAPCKESIPLRCPESSLGNIESVAEELEEERTNSVASPGDHDIAHTDELISMECPPSSTMHNPAPDDLIRQDSPIESFVTDDGNSDMSEEKDEEYFIFTGRTGEDKHSEDHEDDFATNTTTPDPYDCVYHNIPDSTHKLAPKPDCKHCGAKRFQYEPNGFCCRSGKIKLAHTEAPLELQRLYTSADADAVHFRDKFAHGQIYHNVFSFGRSQDGPKHLELYFYDDDPSLQHRFRHSPNLDRDVIRRLVEILKDNPYSQTFRSLGGVEDLEEYRIELNTDMRLDQQRYNVPISSEVAAIWVEGNELHRYFDRSIVLFGNDNKRYSIQPYYGCYDPLSYPLFFPRGEIGWHPEIPKDGVSLAEIRRPRQKGQQGTNTRLCVSVRDYYCYKFQIRRGIFNTMLYGKRLFQQYVVDMYIKVESSRLDYFRDHQKEIRADLYQGVVDSLQAGETRAAAIGKRTILPTSFIGGKRDRRRRYLDAMALVQKYGKPDIFLTMTCNPNWDEILSELEPGQTPQDRPDLIVRVFRAKLEDLKIQLLKRHVLGRVAAYAYVVEFQKRGLPHAHFLLIMEGRYKLTCPEQYDCVISDELPDKYKYPELYDMVVTHMMHGPCGTLNSKNVCMQNGTCKNHYPRPFNAETLQGKDSYPIYRRRDNKRRAKVRGEWLDNRWVVPYNPYLLRRYNCHINVEVCSSIKAVKYLFKYIYKGHDRASICIDEVDSNGDIDEIKQYRDSRSEALWRIYGFDLSEIYPSVRQLQLHLPNMHMVTFPANANLSDVVSQKQASRTMLTEYFEANKKYEWARGILYRDFPASFVWVSNGKYWKKRDERTQIGRIVSAHPAEGERYYLRLLLNHVAGATSFEDLRTVNGVVFPTFREAAEKRGLIEADNTIDECLDEAEIFQMPSALRRLFATILVFCEPSDVRGLWDRHLDAMTEDYRLSHMSSHEVEQMALLDIRNMLQSMGKDISSFPLPEIDESYDATSNEAREIIEESTIEVNQEHICLSSSLNPEQMYAYNEILAAVDSGNGGVFFVDGPGGTGKTYLYKALLGKVRSEGKIAVATATSGVAASILPGGRTAHSRFKIPLNIEDGGGMRQLRLIRNMRAQSDPWFADYLLRVGNGTEATTDDCHIQLPDEICIPYTGEDSDINKLIESVFPMLDENISDPNYITSRAILSTRNEYVDKINMRMIERFPGEEMIYHSFDHAEDDPHNYYPAEFLNSLTPNGLPPHILKLKINCPIILLRNIDPANGLCNGTRLVVRGFMRNAIDAEIVLGQHAGKRVFLPRIPLCPSDDEMFPFRFKRKQFPVRLSFAMTINKAQGQTIPHVGIYLPDPVFSHGQLYVALSRATSRSNIKILAAPENKKDNEPMATGTFTKNIVYREVLTV
ncbi:hypothetical protein ACP70R_017481 [Stipagrostis hirtigluma subsp. patula]